MLNDDETGAGSAAGEMTMTNDELRALADALEPMAAAPTEDV